VAVKPLCIVSNINVLPVAGKITVGDTAMQLGMTAKQHVKHVNHTIH
jgi:hypothetical protein